MGEDARPDPASQPASAGDRPTVILSPSAEFPALNDQELDLLRQVGREWATTLRRPQPRLDALPLDPALGRHPGVPAPTRFGRLAPVQMFRPQPPDELAATERAPQPRTKLGRAAKRLRRAIIGPPLASAAVVQERMRKLVALPVLSSDLLSSVAYGPEALLTVLALAGSAALGLSLPLAAALVVLMIAVGLSYRQTVPAYPHGAGSYIVASDNLGRQAGLVAAAGLMMDYILTVSVSVAAGIQAITSALPGLAPLNVVLGLLALATLLAGNLRGIRAAGNIFAAPTYVFLLALALLLCVGFAQVAGRGFTRLPPPPVPAAEGLGILLVLRAFASGATSMTGIEAVSNAVPAFRPLEWRNGRTTLTWMVSLLIVSFAGLMLLIHLDGLVPRAGETLLSQLARHTFSTGPLYALVQASTALILLLAANTAYNDFPRLLFFMARDCYAPRAFLHMGDRLAFSNGIIALTVAAAVILVAFRGQTQSLIPLFAVGVFLAFTLSQIGMVVHWRRHRGRRWQVRLAINAAGAAMSSVVLLTAAVTKFAAGAWVVVVAVTLIVLLGRRIRHHYDTVARALALHPQSLRAAGLAARPAGREAGVRAESAAAQGGSGGQAGPGGQGGAAGEENPAGQGGPADREEDQEKADTPQEVAHLVVVPVARLDLAALRALAYATSLGQPLLAVHISPDDEEDERFRHQWDTWGNHLRLEIIVSPYRTIIPPLARYLEALHALRPDITLTVIVPEIVVEHRWHQLLHSRTPRRLRTALRRLPGIVIASVPVHIAT